MKTIQMLENRHEALSVKELAKILGESTGHVYRRIRRGEIQGVFRDGRSVRICPAVFVEWLKAKIAEGNCPNQATTTPSGNGQQVHKNAAPSNGAKHQTTGADMKGSDNRNSREDKPPLTELRE